MIERLIDSPIPIPYRAEEAPTEAFNSIQEIC
jgi:hypothetical protein